MSLRLTQGAGGEIIASDDDYKDEQSCQLKLADGTADSSQEIEVANGTAAESLLVTVADDSSGTVKLAAGSAVIGEVEIGSVNGNLSKRADDPHASEAVGIAGLTVRQDTPADLSGTTGDYESLSVSGGRTWSWMQGSKAHDTAITEFDRPLVIGMEAVETDGTAPSLVAEGDVSRVKCDLSGLMLVNGI